MVNNRLQAIVYGVVLATIIGWVLHVGRSVFIPIVFAVLLAYVIVGLARALERLPAVGARLLAWLRYMLSILAIAGLLAACVSLAVNNVGRLVQQAPTYQELLLARIQQVAEFFGVEAAPTWTTLREGLLEQWRLQELIGPTVMSVTGFASAVVIVFVYVAFLLIEKRKFHAKLGMLSDDPHAVARIRDVVDSINSRIGQYLAIKTLINVILASLTVWASLWGIAGAFLAVPIASALVIVFSEFRGTRPIAVLMSRGGRLDDRRDTRGRQRVQEGAAGCALRSEWRAWR